MSSKIQYVVSHTSLFEERNKMTLWMRSLLKLGLCTALMVVTGCGSSEDPELTGLVPVSGQVYLDGQPLSHAGVTFLPQETGMGRPCFGTTDESGMFVLQDAAQRSGCPVGRCKVVVTKFARPDGSPLPSDMDGATAAMEGVEHIPPQYSDAEKTVLEAIVPDSGDEFTFQLTSSPSGKRARRPGA